MNDASQSKMAPTLKGKTIVVHLRDHAMEYPVLLSDCLLEERGKRLFVVGISQPMQRGFGDWTDGTRRALAWDAVEQYFLFESLDEYYRRSEGAAPAESDRTMSLPIIEFPQNESGAPLEPTGISLESDSPLEIGDTVLAYSQGRWWRAEVVDVGEDEQVTIHFPGWDAKWDVTVPKTELQVDLRDSLELD
jgi:hypothetical protein